MTDIETKLKLPTPMKVKPSVIKYLDDFEENGKTIWKFAGADFIETFFYLHLINKYNLNCYPSNKEAKKRERPVGLNLKLKIKYTKEEEAELIIQFKNVVASIMNCVKKGEKIIMIPMSMMNSKGGHANILIYRVDANVIEHFEPHGGEIMDYEKMAESIKRALTLFTNILNKELKYNNLGTVNYITASQVCPYIKGLQTLEGTSKLPKKKIEPSGYCAAWSLFFMELNLKNPELTSSEVLDNIYNYLSTKESGPDYLKKVIRGYTGYIVESVNKYLEIFFKPTYNVSDFLTPKTYFKEDTMRDVLRVLIQLEIMIELDSNFDLQKELKKTMKEYKKKTLGKTKEEQREMRKKNNDLLELYYKKRILQNYEEYKNLGRISEPIIEVDSPESIEEAKFINPTILKKGLLSKEMKKSKAEYLARPDVIEMNRIHIEKMKELAKSRKQQITPGSPKTRKIKSVLPEAFKKQVGDKDKVKIIEDLIKREKIDVNTKEGQMKLLTLLQG